MLSIPWLVLTNLTPLMLSIVSTTNCQTNFMLSDSGRYCPGQVIQTTTALSMLSCVHRCKRKEACRNVNYEHETNICKLLDGDEDNPSQQDLNGVTAFMTQFLDVANRCVGFLFLVMQHNIILTKKRKKENLAELN